MDFLFKYISGLVFAVICFVTAAFVYALLFIPQGSCIGALGIAFAVGILAGVPTGAVLGMFIVDRYILKAAVLRQQVITGFLAGFTVSAFLVFLMFFLGRLESYLLITPKDNPIIGRIILCIFFSVFIIGVLAALLGYTHAGSAKRKITQKSS
jgi:hypothetical protein